MAAPGRNFCLQETKSLLQTCRPCGPLIWRCSMYYGSTNMSALRASDWRYSMYHVSANMSALQASDWRRSMDSTNMSTLRASDNFSLSTQISVFPAQKHPRLSGQTCVPEKSSFLSFLLKQLTMTAFRKYH